MSSSADIAVPETARTEPPRSLMSTIATPTPSRPSSRSASNRAVIGSIGGSRRSKYGGRMPTMSRANGPGT